MTARARLVRGAARFVFWTLAGAVVPEYLVLAGWLVSHP